MINREDMLELTRRMTPSRTSFTRVAGGYMEPDGECKPAQLRIRGWRRTEENAPVVVRNARVRTEK